MLLTVAAPGRSLASVKGHLPSCAILIRRGDDVGICVNALHGPPEPGTYRAGCTCRAFDKCTVASQSCVLCF